MKTLDRSRFFTTNAIGEKRSLTPEGFLVCHDVPIARTGIQIYGADEIPLESKNGEVRIERLPDEVFREETIASFEGKPVTVNHPDDFVTPQNWARLAVGLTQNVRRGTGIEDDLLIADLVITDQAAIEYVNKELPEVSAGYEAAYEQTEPGRGVQRDIVGNHVALVERGRAGPRCSIQDEESTMKKKRSFWDRLMTAVKAQDEEAVKAELESKDGDDDEDEEEGKKGKTGDAVVLGQILDSIKTLTADVASLKAKAKDADGKEDEDDGKKKTDDEDEDEDDVKTGDDILEAETAATNSNAVGKVLSGDALKVIVARAEILSPGIAVPTGDAIKGKGAAHKLMRKSLDQAYATEDGKKAIDVFLLGGELKSLTGDALSSVFSGAAELVRAQNNAKGGRQATASTKDFGRATSVSDINARNRDFWANRSAR